MASIVLAKVGGTVGGLLGGPIGAWAGSAIGSMGGAIIDSALTSKNYNRDIVTAPQIEEFTIQTSVYGKNIPIIYGKVRLSGNIIWASSIKEHQDIITHRQRVGGKGGAKVTQGEIKYNYTISLAIALCEGEVEELIKIWADNELLDLAHYHIRVYKGTEEQLPDQLISSIVGVDKCPAYRGLAYVVIEDFPLTAYGNRLPNFNFEIKRKLNSYHQHMKLEEYIDAVNIIPGSGEFVYDTKIQYKQKADKVKGKIIPYGPKEAINMHNNLGIANAIYSFKQLKQDCPNIKWVAPVVTWFTTSLNAKDAKILPAIEFRDNIYTSDEWKVADFKRKTAYEISKNSENKPNYGGTVNDESVLRYLDFIKEQNVKVMFYPMFFVDLPDKPWRGHLTGTPEDIIDFFNKKNGYNDFILHYASLVKDKVDVFLIGSELIGLTKVKNEQNEFVAVNELVKLAKKVKNILGEKVLVSYAADWSEYHHTEGGWYNLDDLWASSDIDFIGIDAYFPILDSIQNDYEYEKVKKGWFQGEGYDYILDDSRKYKTIIEPKYAWKNIQYWWENEHINPDGSKTLWQPKSKKIWFTEFGFPSLDGAANQPNVFYDPNCRDGAIPRHSRGSIDFIAQASALLATYQAWQNSEMVENKFVWTWDARPYPFWPNLGNVWADGNLWAKGHWLNGKLGITNIADVITDIALKAGFNKQEIDVSNLEGYIPGFIVSNASSARVYLEILQKICFFDLIEENGVINFVMKKNSRLYKINNQDIIIHNNKTGFASNYQQASQIPTQLDIIFFNQEKNYKLDVTTAKLEYAAFNKKAKIELPIFLSSRQAQIIAELVLENLWKQKSFHELMLPRNYYYLKPSDLIKCHVNNYTYIIRITKITYSKDGMIIINGFEEDNSNYDLNHYALTKDAMHHNYTDYYVNQYVESKIEIMELSLIFDANYKYGVYAALYSEYKGCCNKEIYKELNGKIEYVATMKNIAIAGEIVGELAKSSSFIIDYQSELLVYLYNNEELNSVNHEEFLNGANMALIGDELIYFQTAELMMPGKYKLKNFIRNRAIIHNDNININKKIIFLLINDKIQFIPLNMNDVGMVHNFANFSLSSGPDNSNIIKHEFKAVALKPLKPVHLRARRMENNSLEISWIAQSKLVMDWKNEIDMPALEEDKFYIEVYVNDELYKNYGNLTQNIFKISLNELMEDKKIDKVMVKLIIHQVSEMTGLGEPATYECSFRKF